ncbi:MAG: aminomethyltransferase family protein [Acidobacteriota bacterium]|nr:aminomethyltransferase family protein [Blastocatellia bacterium]MDW8413734.1 aminomethyltransferase family protein [Acidobacteriota bacterium]
MNELEYKAVRSTVGLLDLSARGRIEVSGRNSVQFLQGLVSNDVKLLTDGEGTYAAFLNATGRIQADCFIYRDGERFLIDVPTIRRSWVYDNLTKFSPAGGFDVSDVTDQTVLLSLQGPQSTSLLRSLGIEEPVGYLKAKWGKIGGVATFVTCVSRTGEQGYDLFASVTEKSQLLKVLTDAGATPVAQETAEVLRIEAGIPAYGQDMDDSIILLEAGLDHAVSYKKGCYLGQETIAKIHHRGQGQTAKRLAGLLIDSTQIPEIRSKIYNDAGNEIGYVTSSCYSPILGRAIALAYLRRNNFSIGMRHTIASGGGEHRLAAEVVALPFVGTYSQGKTR